jgi:serine/threonine protein phosphatase PrpC
MKVALRSDVGITRKTNEDFAFARSEIGLAILADGMGGHLAGEVASRLAVETVATKMTEALKTAIGECAAESIHSMLARFTSDANRKLRERAAEDINLKGMGTTIVSALDGGDCVHIAHVGDSRAYLFRKGTLTQITRDHSLVSEMVASGEISAKAARSHRLRSVLTRALGADPEVQVEVQTLSWHAKDVLLLCSDGLTTMVEDRKIGKILGRFEFNLEAACDELVRAANSGGGKDNVTVILACPT